MAELTPALAPQRLQLRAQALRRVREFFHDLGVMEVDTPALGITGASDPNIALLAVTDVGNTQTRWLLQSSPEFYMKRLLAAGSGPIYQLSHVFRAGEAGRYHQPEFTMLEWYQPDYTLAELVAETKALISLFDPVLAQRDVLHCSYDDFLLQRFGIDSDASEQALRAALKRQQITTPSHADRAQLLDRDSPRHAEPCPGEGRQGMAQAMRRRRAWPADARLGPAA